MRVTVNSNILCLHPKINGGLYSDIFEKVDYIYIYIPKRKNK